MSDDRVDLLLERWGDLRRQGRDVPAEELCRDCQELTGEVGRRIKALKATEWLERPLEDDATVARPEKPDDFGLPAALGRYRLDELIGTGGFGQVWRAFDPEIQRVVAVKIARPDRVSTPEQAEAFLAEARKVGQLKHPGIVPVHDVGRQDGWCFIVSEFIEGGNLAERIAADRPSPQQAARLVAEIADILHFAHRQGVVHRDVKPANILLDKDGKPFVGDFGIALSSRDTGQTASSTAGTLAYMSPEQVRGEQQVDARTDIYSLGVVFYEMLTGRVLFAAPNPADLQTVILSVAPKPPRAIDDTISPAFERICLRALSKEPQDRFATAKEFAARLRAVVEGRRRRRWLMTAALGMLVMLGAWVGSWMIARSHQPREETPPPATPSSDAIKQAEVIKNWSNLTSPAAVKEAEDTKNRSIKAAQDALAMAFGHLQEETTFEIGGHATSRPASTAPATPIRISITDTRIDLSGRMLDDADFDRLGNQAMLKELVLANTTTSDKQLARLQSCLALEDLDLSGTQVTDTGLESVARRIYLRSFSLARTKITNAGLKHLGGIHIRILNLSGTRITDKGLAYLTDRYGAGGYLTDLDLSNTAITDACIEHVKKIAGLENLRLIGTKVSDDGIGRLKAALPKCKIER